MELDYQSAMDQLQSMFHNFDEETIRTVLASNDGHVERTIDDLMKLTEEVENQTDDDNLFSDRPRKTSTHNTGSYQDFGARTTQETEDARMAYDLQMQYMREEKNANQHAIRNSTNNTRPVNTRTEVYNRPEERQVQNVQNTYNANVGSNQNQYNSSLSASKKPNFMKKVKIGLQNLFKRKGKTLKKGPTNNVGAYEEFEPSESGLAANAYGINNGAQYEQREEEEENSPMRLSDVLGNQGIEKGEIQRQDTPPQNRYNVRRDQRRYNESHQHDQEVSHEHIGYS